MWNRIALALLLPACLAAPDEATLESPLADGPCPKWGCGANTPVMGPYGFHELHTGGLPNAEGLRIIDFVRDGTTYEPRVRGARLTAVAAGGDELTGEALTGGRFRITDGRHIYLLVINHVTPRATSPVKFWIGPAAPIETYELVYTGPGITQDVVCHNPPERDSGEGGGRIWERPLEAILYSGDRYDADHKRVIATGRGTDGWFTIACAGSAFAKLVLTRHAEVGMTTGFATAPHHRQALLKMYAGDFCGGGVPFTEPGTPLHWRNQPGWSALHTGDAPEALWTDDGALCLSNHRLGADWYDAVQAACGRPACPPVAPNAPIPLGAYLATAIP